VNGYLRCDLGAMAESAPRKASIGTLLEPLFGQLERDERVNPGPLLPVAGAHLGVAREWVLRGFIHVRADEVRAVLAPDIGTVLQTFKKVQNPLGENDRSPVTANGSLEEKKKSRFHI